MVKIEACQSLRYELVLAYAALFCLNAGATVRCSGLNSNESDFWYAQRAHAIAKRGYDWFENLTGAARKYISHAPTHPLDAFISVPR